MAACEVCWERAQFDVMVRGGSVVDHYRRRTKEDGHERRDNDE